MLLLDGQLDMHLVNLVETKLKDTRFVRVDSDVIEKLIQKEEKRDSKLDKVHQDDLKAVFNSQIKSGERFNVMCEILDENDAPVIITQSEFIRRMKDMSQIGGGMNFYGDLPDSYNLVLNPNHAIMLKISDDLTVSLGEKLAGNDKERTRLREEIDFMEKEHSKKKADEISQLEKDDLDKLRRELDTFENGRKETLTTYGAQNKLVRQLIDLALLSNNMLRGEDLNVFVKRSVELL